MWVGRREEVGMVIKGMEEGCLAGLVNGVENS